MNASTLTCSPVTPVTQPTSTRPPDLAHEKGDSPVLEHSKRTNFEVSIQVGIMTIHSSSTQCKEMPFFVFRAGYFHLHLIKLKVHSQRKV